MAIVAIILARGGSKRIPAKNIHPFRGAPLISWAIRAALQWPRFDEVIVSTDSEDIARVAIEHGARFDGLRAAAASDDHATTADALRDAIAKLAARGKHPDHVCCIYGSSAFVTPALLEAAYARLIDGDFDTVFPVMQFGYPIWRALERDADGEVRFQWPEHTLTRSQDLKPAFHDAGQFYLFRTRLLLETGSLTGGRTGSIEIPESLCHDIDTPEDLAVAEIKHACLERLPA